jgi:tetratricopeptide (TPR) repeat protein
MDDPLKANGENISNTNKPARSVKVYVFAIAGALAIIAAGYALSDYSGLLKVKKPAAPEASQAITREINTSNFERLYVDCARFGGSDCINTVSYAYELQKSAPIQARVAVLQGLAYLKLGNRTDAEQVFKNALAIDPNNATAGFWLAKINEPAGPIPSIAGPEAAQAATELHFGQTRAIEKMNAAELPQEIGVFILPGSSQMEAFRADFESGKKGHVALYHVSGDTTDDIFHALLSAAQTKGLKIMSASITNSFGAIYADAPGYALEITQRMSHISMPTETDVIITAEAK